MQFQKSELNDLPESYNYAFDAHGFFCGIVKKQKHPMREGEYLTPANSTHIKPDLVEGYRPKWSGVKWDLISKNPEVLEVESVVSKKVLEAKRDETFDCLKNSLSDFMKCEVRTFVDERADLFLKNFGVFIDDTTKEFEKKAFHEHLNMNDKFKSLEDSFFSRLQEMLNQIEEKRNELEILKNDVSILVGSLRVDQIEQKSFFGKIVDYFKSKEPALIEPPGESGGKV